MATYSQLPGTLNLAVPQGNDLSAAVNFSVDLTGYELEATATSVSNGDTVATFEVTVTDDEAGEINLALSDAQTAGLAVGTYRWTLVGTQGELTRTYLAGHLEVTR